MADFEHEVRAPFLPTAPVRRVMRWLAMRAGRHGLDTRYLRLRKPPVVRADVCD
jgi:hypothetical protein